MDESKREADINESPAPDNAAVNENPVPATVVSKPKLFVFLLLQMLPLAALIGAVYFLIQQHEQVRQADAPSRANLLSQYELKRLTGIFNYRLNELREELLHLYGEQANLAKALGENEREKWIFFRRPHLAAYAVLTQKENSESSPESSKETGTEWLVQKYYLNGGGSASEQVIHLFKETIRNSDSNGLGMKSVKSDLFPLPSSDSEAYAVAFSTTDESGKRFAVLGVYRPSYLFPFCKFFTDSLGAMNVHAYVLNRQGNVLCHSQPKFNGADFKTYSLYQEIQKTGDSGGQARYPNVYGNPVSAAVRKVKHAGLVFVTEVAEVSPWETIVPYSDLLKVGGGVFGVTLLAGLFSGVLVLRKPVPKQPKEKTTNGEKTEELEELSAMLLDMQASQAFVSSFQKAAVEATGDQDLGQLFMDHLKPWETPVFRFKVEGQKAILQGGVQAAEIELKSFDYPDQLAHDSELKEKVISLLEISSIEAAGSGASVDRSFTKDQQSLVLQPVYFGSELLEIWVFACVKDQNREIVPQLAQIYAFVTKARQVS